MNREIIRLCEKRLLRLLLTLVFCHVYLAAQPAALLPQQRQAIIELKRLYEDSKDIGDDKERIDARAEIAKLLWNYDKQKARSYFAETYKAISQIEDEKRSIPFLYSPKMMLRRKVLGEVMVRDSELAEMLIQTMTTTGASNEDRRKLYLGLAGFLLSKDSKRAAKIVQNNLEGGADIELMRALRSLRQKEPAIADDLLRQWLLKQQINAENPMGDFLVLSIYFRPSEKESDNKNVTATSNELPAILIEPLLDFAFKALTLHSEQEQKLMVNPPRERFVMGDILNAGIIASLLPLFEKYRPDQVSLVRAYLGQAANTLPDNVRNGDVPSRPKTIDDILNEAQKEKNDFLRDFHYRDAVQRAEQAEDYDRAIEIAGKVGDQDQRPDTSLIRERAAHAALRKGNLGDAYRFAKDLLDVSERANLYSKIALKASEQSEIQRATELLNAAEKLMEKTPTTPKQVTALLQIASTKAAMNWARSFEATKLAIEAINELYANKSQAQKIYFSFGTESFEGNLGILARHDFQRSLSLAQAIKKKEISVTAQLAVCASVLEEKTIER